MHYPNTKHLHTIPAKKSRQAQQGPLGQGDVMDHKSQGGRDENSKTGEETGKSGGLEFMAIRFNVADKRRNLRVSKEVTPAEYFLLEEIERGTIGAHNAKRMICSEAEFYLKDLAENLGILVNKIYVQLKSLQKKNLIVRRSTRSKGLEIIGLNPTEFGQVLIDTQHEIEKKRHLKLAVDNSKKSVDVLNKEVLNKEASSPKSGLICTRFGTSLVPIQDQTDTQNIEIIEEKPLLDSSKTYLESFRTGKTIFNLSGSPKSGPENGDLSQEEIRKRKLFLKAQAETIDREEKRIAEVL